MYFDSSIAINEELMMQMGMAMNGSVDQINGSQIGVWYGWVDSIPAWTETIGGNVKISAMPDGIGQIGILARKSQVPERLFRSLILSNLMRITRTYRQMIGAVFASSLLFSVSHLTNLLNGADPGATVSQLISAACFGVFLAGIYLSCGSIIPCMAFHFGHDVLALLFLGINESGATVEKVTMVSNIENMIVNVLLLALGFMLLRSRNFEEIRRLWDEKWHIETDRSIDAGEISASESVRRQ